MKRQGTLRSEGVLTMSPLRNSPAPRLSPTIHGHRTAEEVAARTAESLDCPGWCLWQCEALDGEVIAVIDEALVENLPDGYPTYTIGELYRLLEVPDETLRLVHEAKKHGAIIMQVQTENQGRIHR